MKFIRYILIILCGLILTFPFYFSFIHFHIKLPDGCDQFGYLNLAKAISENKLFENHAERPFDKELLPYLKNSLHKYSSYYNLISPHSYHIGKNNFKIIHQYPPGVGIILSVFPIYSRKVFFPAVSALMLLIFLLLAFKIESNNISLFQLNLIVIILTTVLYINDFKSALVWVNAVAPTFGILIAAGYLLEKKPNISIILLGFSILFRIANVILFPLFLYVYLSKNLQTNEIFSFNAITKTIKAFILLILGGLGIYLLYVWILLGNPLYSTYSQIDQQFSLKFIPESLKYYINFKQAWFRLHIELLIIMVVFLKSLKINKKWFIFSIVISIYNYLFYLLHDWRISYYPCVTSLIIIGIILFQFKDKIIKMKSYLKINRMMTTFSVIMIIFAFISSYKFFKKSSSKYNYKKSFYEQMEIYKKYFSKYDVVWAEIKSGTIEYATSTASFRYICGEKEPKFDIILWLKSHGYKQAIWKEDLKLPLVDIERDLNELGIKYKYIESPELGEIIEIL